jgi:hypothetical protein
VKVFILYHLIPSLFHCIPIGMGERGRILEALL